jgi:putative ABC transport system permease protein
MLNDFRYAIRMLRRDAGFTTVAVITLALGIGANTAIFSVVNAILLRPLPYSDPEHLAMLWTNDPKRDIHEEGTSYLNFEDWKNQNQVFEDLAICTRGNPVTLTSFDEPERIEAEAVSANLFSVLGSRPILGRTFSLDDMERRQYVVVLSYNLWQRRFGGAQDLVGKTMEINGRSTQIIGVMPAEFYFPARETQLWEPVTVYSWWERTKGNRYNDWWRVVGRLKRNVSFRQAQTEMNAIGNRLEHAYPTTDPEFAGFGINVVPLLTQITGEKLPLALWALLGAVVFVLLIACTNVASLVLARGTAREKEFAIRLALGGGRMRLIRQALIESTTLSLVAGLLGLILAGVAIPALAALAPPNIPRLDEVDIDARVLAFALGLSMLAGILFGLVPALKLSQNDPSGSLKESGRGASGGARSHQLRGLLVVAEFALAVVLLVGSGLLIRSFLRLQTVDLGLKAERVLTMKVIVPESKNVAQKAAFYQQAFERLIALPGVQAVGAISHVFLETNPDITITVEGSAISGQAAGALMDDVVSSGYFTTMGIPLLKGRFFSDQDGPESPRVAIINETMARRFFPGEDPIGQRFKYGDPQSRGAPLTIVGVVKDVRRQGLERQPLPQIFISLSQNPNRAMTLVVRTVSEPMTFAATVRQEIRSIDKTVTLYSLNTVEQQLEEFSAERRFQTWLLGVLSVMALALAAIGIYGVMHYAVSQRTREIGIRIALGAQARDVLCLVVRQGIRLALIGAAVGLVCAAWLTQTISNLLFDVAAVDPATFASAAFLLIGAAFFACYFPARRATRIDPMVALRYE